MKGRPMGDKLKKHPAHPSPVRRHNEPVILHVTVCTKEKQHILAEGAVHTALVQAWKEAIHWLTGYYLVMPDHIHLFCAPRIDPPPPVRRWAGYWKRQSGIKESSIKRQFQEDCWDTQMRSQEHYVRKLEYVRQNPVRWELVEQPEDWPYQGRIHSLPWI